MAARFPGKYVVDDKGRKVGVLLEVKAYRKMLAELEELEAVRAYDAAKASGEEPIGFEHAVVEIEQSR